MTEVLAPMEPSTSPSHIPPSESPESLSSLPPPREPRPQPRERIPSYGQNRMSHYSHRTSRSRPQSTAFPAFPSSLPYALVRDFAYPLFHPMHYGAPPDPPSGATTPGSEWTGGRRLSDPVDGTNNSSSHFGGWSAGPFGDGGMYEDPENDMEPLPSTSFGEDGGEAGDEAARSQSKSRKHRKSKSYASFSDYERGRRRESAGLHRRSRASGDGEASLFAGHQMDPAGRASLRQSRGPGTGPATAENGGTRRDSHFAATLAARSFRHGEGPAGPNIDPDSDMPLDAEIPTSRSYSPQRQSIGPEDEELYAGQSLALYAFEPENANELRLREGQVVMVSYRHGQGWLVAEDPESGEHGLVPEAYVRLLSELPHYDPETGDFREVEDGELDDLTQEESHEDGEIETQEDGEVESGLENATKELRVDEAYEEAGDDAVSLDAKKTEGEGKER